MDSMRLTRFGNLEFFKLGIDRPREDGEHFFLIVELLPRWGMIGSVTASCDSTVSTPFAVWEG